MTHYGTQPDERCVRECIELANSGDGLAFGNLYDVLYDKVYRYVYRRVYDEQNAQDITANTFYQIMTHLHSFRWKSEAQWYAWVFRIAMHEIVNFQRKGNKYQLAEDWLAFDEITSDDRELQSVTAERNERHETLHAHIAMMPEKSREIIELYYFADLSHDAIAQTLGIREGAARVRLHRAVEQLQLSMKGAGYEY